MQTASKGAVRENELVINVIEDNRQMSKDVKYRRALPQ
jgi:hypothetical protein